MFGNYSFDGNSKYERDPNLLKLEKDIFNSLEEIASDLDPARNNDVHSGDIRFVSFEDALKELITIKNKK